jgi:N-acetylglucosamine kinase-like BadF-type ATPase
MSLYLAIDAGGTKADYALVDDSKILARVRSGTIKRMRTDAGTASANLDQALRELTQQSGIDLRTVARTCVGTAGETVPLVTDWLKRELSVRVGGELLILGDVEIALDAAFPGEPGILVLAGTGSNVAGRTPQGKMLNAGGWGPVLADQGSGHRIGHQALRAIFLAIDGGVETSLLSSVLEYWGLNNVPELVAHSNALPSPDFSQLVRIVLECADRGDDVAKSVLSEQGKELAHIIGLLIQRMRISANDPAFTPRLAFAGSIMEKVRPVRQALVQGLRVRFPDVLANEGVVDPVEGAIWRARSG